MHNRRRRAPPHPVRTDRTKSFCAEITLLVAQSHKGRVEGKVFANTQDKVISYCTHADNHSAVSFKCVVISKSRRYLCDSQHVDASMRTMRPAATSDDASNTRQCTRARLDNGPRFVTRLAGPVNSRAKTLQGPSMRLTGGMCQHMRVGRRRLPGQCIGGTGRGGHARLKRGGQPPVEVIYQCKTRGLPRLWVRTTQDVTSHGLTSQSGTTGPKPGARQRNGARPAP